MTAYVIGEIEVTDPATYSEYGRQVLATIEGETEKRLLTEFRLPGA